MSKSDFDAFVKRQQLAEQEESPFDPQQQLREWIGYLDLLYETINGYLAKYLRAGGIYIDYKSIVLNEDFIGDYSVKMMTLKIGKSSITFTPIGTMLIGSKGRVDVQGPRGSARMGLINRKATHARQLIHVTITQAGDPPPPKDVVRPLIDWAWKIITSPPEIRFLDLTEEAFFDMILAVADA